MFKQSLPTGLLKGAVFDKLNECYLKVINISFDFLQSYASNLSDEKRIGR